MRDVKLFVEPAVTHISPDGTVNRLCGDGVYRAVPGAAKQTPAQLPQGTFAPGCSSGSCGFPQSVPQYLPQSFSLPQGGCANGNCPGASTTPKFRVK